MGEGREWAVELDVREDAPSMFLPAERVPDAVVGDHIVITSTQPAAIRRGRIVELLDDAQRGRFFAISLDDDAAIRPPEAPTSA